MDKGEYYGRPLFVEDTPSHDNVEPTTVCVDSHVRFEKIDAPQHQQGLEKLAKRESGILYVCRGCRLVRTVRSPNLERKLCVAQ